MAHVMIKKETCDLPYLDTYTIGFEAFKNYVMGKDDGQPKTPVWAEGITGVPATTIEQ